MFLNSLKFIYVRTSSITTLKLIFWRLFCSNDFFKMEKIQREKMQVTKFGKKFRTQYWGERNIISIFKTQYWG